MKGSRILFCAAAVMLNLQSSAEQHLFSVRDSIEMAEFTDPSGSGTARPQFAPDGSRFIVVTSRGQQSSNTIQSTIWLFEKWAVRRYVGAKRTSPPLPRLLVSVSAVPVIHYGTIISKLEWAQDSRAIYFLKQDSTGTRHLCRVEIGSGALQTISPPEYDVERYSVAGDLIVYNAIRGHSDQRSTANRSFSGRSGAISGTGMSLVQLLDPNSLGWPSPRVHELWSMRNGKLVQVARSSPDAEEENWDVLSISPNRKQVVQIKPALQVPASWQAYAPLEGFDDWRQNLNSSPGNIYRAKEYVLVDLGTGRTHPIVHAPYGASLAHFESPQAVWAADGRRLLLTNTYLPLESADRDERLKRQQVCAIADVELASNEIHCLVFSRDANAKQSALRLDDVRFGRASDEVHANFTWRPSGRHRTELYRYTQSGWKVADTVDASVAGDTGISAKGGSLSIQIEETLNDPPALWAEDSSTGKRKELWDPNPQLSRIRFGEAIEYRWKDKTGYEWTGGLVKPVDYIPGRRYPLVIQTHGFAAGQFITDGIFSTGMAARPLASAGFLVLQMSDTFKDHGKLREPDDYLAGYESAIQQLASDGLADSHRVGIVGFSRTCWHVEHALIEEPNLFAAASINDGIDQSYMSSMMFDVGRASEAQGLYGASPWGKGLEKWLELAPSFHLDRIRTPLLITAITPPSLFQEWEIYSSLYQQEKPVDLLYIADGQHVLQKPQDRLVSQQTNVDWFRFWLQGYERLEPDTIEEYGRWEKLRQQ
jgi:dipeptidyl aminopeptidase/acylaminoacyl peptidase